MGVISKLYKIIALSSPYAEVLLRRLYWNNVNRLGKYNPNKVKHYTRTDNIDKVDFNRILKWLRQKGIEEGDILIVHSSYGELEKTGLSPDEIIDGLLELIGPSGTLAMPVIRRYKDMNKAEKEGKDMSLQVFKYNVKKTMITSGMLPYTLMQRDNAVVSHHPFNPLCAVGPSAKDMMKHNLEGIAPSPHGPNSCWRFCYDHGAKVCSIGTDIEHHNTIGHIVEESFGDWYWPDEIWYNRFKFEITDEEKHNYEVVVSNRKEAWGKRHLADINACEDLKKAGIMSSDIIDGITLGYVDPQRMASFLRSRNKKGYPYIVFPWDNLKILK